MTLTIRAQQATDLPAVGQLFGAAESESAVAVRIAGLDARRFVPSHFLH